MVLVSGSGTNLQALLDAAADPAFPAEVVAVGADAGAIVGARARRARPASRPSSCALADYADRAAWDAALADAVAAHEPDWVVCAGLHAASSARRSSSGSPAAIVNTHPALLPSFPGAHGGPRRARPTA